MFNVLKCGRPFWATVFTRSGASVAPRASAAFAALLGVSTLALVAATPAFAFNISGTVFEDVNYGGGAGRSQAASSGVVRSSARVELFNIAGVFV